MLKLKPQDELVVKENIIVVAEDAKMDHSFFERVNLYNNSSGIEIVNDDHVVSFTLLGHDQGFKKALVDMIREYFVRNLGSYSTAACNGFIDRCVLIFDLDVFCENHSSNKSRKTLKQIIKFLKNTNLVIGEEQIELEFVILNSFPDITTYVLPFYDIDLHFFDTIDKKKSYDFCKMDCQITQRTNFLQCGECTSCKLNLSGAKVDRDSSKDVLLNNCDEIFKHDLLAHKIEIHNKKVLQIYGKDKLSDFSIDKLDYDSYLDLFTFHSCVSMLFKL